VYQEKLVGHKIDESSRLRCLGLVNFEKLLQHPADMCPFLDKHLRNSSKIAFIHIQVEHLVVSRSGQLSQIKQAES
jgi:hypothetical protein